MNQKKVPRIMVVSRKIKPSKPDLPTSRAKRRWLTWVELEKRCPQLASWLKPLARWSQNVVFVADAENGYKVRLYTANHIYHIKAIPKRYLGCVAIARKTRVAEDWFRGNDLRDGKWSRATWQKILGDIVSYELEPAGTPSWGTVKDMQEIRHAKH